MGDIMEYDPHDTAIQAHDMSRDLIESVKLTMSRHVIGKSPNPEHTTTLALAMTVDAVLRNLHMPLDDFIAMLRDANQFRRAWKGTN
jgi:hypothetical protein